MLVLTTPSIEGKSIQAYHGIVTGSTVRARHIWNRYPSDS